MFHFTHSFLHPSLCCIAPPSVGFYRSWAEPVSHLFSWRFRITQLFFNLLLKWSSWIDTLAFFSQTVGVCFHVWVDFFLSVLIYLCLVSVFEDGSNKGKSCHFFPPFLFFWDSVDTRAAQCLTLIILLVTGPCQDKSFSLSLSVVAVLILRDHSILSTLSQTPFWLY